MKSERIKIRDNLTSLQSPISRGQFTRAFIKPHTERIKAELKANGALPYDLLLPETYYLPTVIHDDEHIKGSIYGRYEYEGAIGRGALVATDQRVIFLDKKPFFVHYDEINFMIIGSVTYTRTAIVGYVTLRTRLGNFQLRTFNHRNAYNFVQYIEEHCLRHRGNEKFDHVT